MLPSHSIPINHRISRCTSHTTAFPALCKALCCLCTCTSFPASAHLALCDNCYNETIYLCCPNNGRR